MKTHRILIAFSFPIVLTACAPQVANNSLTPITRWFLAVRERVHPPIWHEPSDSLEKIAKHWRAVVDRDMDMAWHFANRPDKISDSTVIELSGDYVPSDSLPQLFAYHCARFDTAENAQENYTIDYSRQYATNPDYWKNKPIVVHSADRHRSELEALKTALVLHRQVIALASDSGWSRNYRYGMK